MISYELFLFKFITMLCFMDKFKCSGDLNTELPSFFTPCKRDDPNLDKCIMSTIEELRPHLVQGIPEFDIPPLEPLHIPEINFNQGKGPVTVRSKYSDLIISGPSEFEIKSLKIDLKKEKILTKLWFPYLNMVSNYDLDGRIMMLPVSGHGISEGNFTDINADILMEGSDFVKDGKKHLNVDNIYIDFQMGGASIKLHNLFNGDSQIGSAINQFLNENWRSITEEVKNGLESSLADMCKTLANNIFHKFPLDVLLPQK